MGTHASAKFLAAAIAASAAMAPAEARIVCNGSYQLVAGQEISTPYCRDKNLAQVARERGMKVTDADIRNNPNTKESVCRVIGRLNRVSDACNSDSDSSRGK